MTRSTLCSLLLALAVISAGSFALCAQAQPQTLILYGGQVIPMTNQDEVYEAIAISGNEIIALGQDEEILALASASTQLVDLAGRAAFPGFIDPHTHLFDNASQEGMTLEQVQQMAIENGITTAANMFTTPWNIVDYISFAQAGGMRFRYYLYLIYTDSCGGIEGFWYEDYLPKEEIAPRLFMGGVKLFAERSVCGQETVMFNFSQAIRETLTDRGSQMWGDAWLILSEDDLTDVIARIQEKGYQAAIHAVGDLAIETCLNAYETVLDGQPNELRHMILHNQFLRDDMLPRYAELGVPALVEMTSPQSVELYSRYVGEDNLYLFRRWSDLLQAGALMAIDSDWNFYPISPIDKLRAFVGGENMDSDLTSLGPCEDRSPQLLSTWDALVMMTKNAAYALCIEESLGTLAPGKLADVVVLSQNPLKMDPLLFATAQVDMTIIDGQVEWDRQQ